MFFQLFKFFVTCGYPPLNQTIFLIFWQIFKFSIIFRKTYFFWFSVISSLLGFLQIHKLFSLFLFRFAFPRREISISPAMRGWGKDCRNILCTMGNLLGRKSRHLWFYFFFTIKPLESAGQSAKTYYKKWAPDCQKSQQFFAPILKK